MIQFTLHKKLHAANGIMHMNVSCEIQRGQLVSIYGSSGAGKTSTLRMLAGFLDPDKGIIQFNNEVWFDSNKKIKLAPQKRKIGFVFQDYALFPNMTVKENLRFALNRGENGDIIDELMSVTELEQLYGRRIQTLSGGQKQRVALARALVRKPELLLLDEPLSAIDNELRLRLQDILINLHRRFNLTTILVSHDISEIVRLSDTTILLENGLVKRRDTPADIFFLEHQNNDFSLNGDIIEIKKPGSNFEVSILISNQVIKLIVEEVNNLKKGDKVIITSKEFKPVIQKRSF